MENLKCAYLWPHNMIFVFPAPPPLPPLTSLWTTVVVSQSTNRSVAAVCRAFGSNYVVTYVVELLTSSPLV